ncbi:LysR family transcriptional regulator [Mycolicibacterium poriferae]|uniref:LysR family transcriptional regulator n=1 Tax=Mycolicibacterium poriferae TaxID=39694 RepID=UPI0024BB5435|nr:LysR family transcriptional regulator [Mycolicibacterium poriferae]
MDLRQLEYFVAVVEERSFTRAAARERVAQPAVSAQIRRLERTVGQPLLHRTSREIGLTQAGWALLPHARAALAAVRDGRAAVDEIAGVVSGEVAIGTVTSHPFDIARLLADFHAHHPAVEIALTTATSDELLVELRDGRLDAVIASVAVDDDPPDLNFAMITEEVIEAAVASGHPLAGRKSLRLSDLASHPVISLPSGTGLRSRLQDACAGAGVVPRIAFEATSPQELAELAVHGLGVAILPQSMTRAHPQLQTLRIVPALRGRLVWAWRRGVNDPAARLICERALQMIGERGLVS